MRSLCLRAQHADLDKSGKVDKEELGVVLKDQLHIQLQDPVNDLDLIFGATQCRVVEFTYLPPFALF